MKKAIILISLLFALNAYTQNPTPFVAGNGYNLLLVQGNTMLGGYTSNLGDSTEEVQCGFRCVDTAFGVILVYNKQEPMFTPSIKIGSYNNNLGVYISYDGTITMVAENGINTRNSIKSYTDATAAYFDIPIGSGRFYKLNNTGDIIYSRP